MKIVFIGTVEFSKKALQKLIDIDAEVVGVCTKEKSNFNSDFTDLTSICNKNSIPYKFVTDINSIENINWIKTLNPDIIFCFGWSSLIKKELLILAPMGVVGFHPTKLPENRGRHPLIWALALGLKESASTFFFMDEGADSGDILSQKQFNISDIDNAQTLYKKVVDVALIQIEDFVPKLQNNTYERIKQNHNLANTWRKRGKTDGKIDFRMSSEAIYNLVRALTKPYIGAHIEYKGQDISIWKVSIVESSQNNIECGKVLKSDNNKFTVKTYNGAIEILEHDFNELPEIMEYL
jgi:methionyl-tRNA formyltransferase